MHILPVARNVYSSYAFRNHTMRAALVAPGLAPPPAQGVVLETEDPVPHWAPCLEPASPPTCVSASLSLYLS